MVLKVEAGLRDYRIEFHREDTQGQPDTNPSWQLYSDTVRNFEWSPDGQIEQTLGIGVVDPSAFLKGPESHELTIAYDLQRALLSGGNPLDPSADGLERDTDNGPTATHSFVAREEKTGITAEETINGSTSKDTRIYTVGDGGLVDTVTYNGDPGSQNPVLVEITYQFEKVRSYQIDQPGSSTTLDIVSSDAGDGSSIKVTIENEGAGTSEENDLNGVTPVTTTNSFADIDAVYVHDVNGDPIDHDGDITISENGGDDLMVIPGSTSYDGLEGDNGVPLLGTSSHPAPLGSSFELIIGDTVTRNGTAAEMAFDLNSVSLTVNNNVETTTRIDTLAQRYHMGTRNLELSATVLGEAQSHADVLEHLQVNEADIVWTLTNSTITLSNAALTDVGSRSIEAGQAVLTLDNTFTGRGLTVA